MFRSPLCPGTWSGRVARPAPVVCTFKVTGVGKPLCAVIMVDEALRHVEARHGAIAAHVVRILRRADIQAAAPPWLAAHDGALRRVAGLPVEEECLVLAVIDLRNENRTAVWRKHACFSTSP